MEHTNKKTMTDSDNVSKFCFYFPSRYRKKTIGLLLILLLIVVISIMLLCLLFYLMLFWHLGLHFC